MAVPLPMARGVRIALLRARPFLGLFPLVAVRFESVLGRPGTADYLFIGRKHCFKKRKFVGARMNTTIIIRARPTLTARCRRVSFPRSPKKGQGAHKGGGDAPYDGGWGTWNQQGLWNQQGPWQNYGETLLRARPFLSLFALVAVRFESVFGRRGEMQRRPGCPFPRRGAFLGEQRHLHTMSAVFGSTKQRPLLKRLRYQILPNDDEIPLSDFSIAGTESFCQPGTVWPSPAGTGPFSLFHEPHTRSLPALLQIGNGINILLREHAVL